MARSNTAKKPAPQQGPHPSHFAHKIANQARQILTRHYCRKAYHSEGSACFIATLLRLYFFAPVPNIGLKAIQLNHRRIINSLPKTAEGQFLRGKWLDEEGQIRRSYYRMLERTTARDRDFCLARPKDESLEGVCFVRFQPAVDAAAGEDWAPNFYQLSPEAQQILRDELGDIALVCSMMTMIQDTPAPAPAPPKPKPAPPKPRPQRKKKKPDPSMVVDDRTMEIYLHKESEYLESIYDQWVAQDRPCVKPVENWPFSGDKRPFSGDHAGDCEKIATVAQVPESNIFFAPSECRNRHSTDLRSVTDLSDLIQQDKETSEARDNADLAAPTVAPVAMRSGDPEAPERRPERAACPMEEPRTARSGPAQIENFRPDPAFDPDFENYCRARKQIEQSKAPPEIMETALRILDRTYERKKKNGGNCERI